MHHYHARTLVFALLLIVAALATAQAPAQSPAQDTVRFEVAEIPGAFTFAGPTDEDGWPIQGATFITQGYIYPAGTLQGEHGVLPDGSPTYPDAVIGKWTCRGWVLGEGFAAVGVPNAISTQLFEFDEAYGGDLLVTEGYEYMELGLPFTRTITSGTGRFAGLVGEVRQELVSMNEDMLVGYAFDVPLEVANP